MLRECTRDPDSRQRGRRGIVAIYGSKISLVGRLLLAFVCSLLVSSFGATQAVREQEPARPTPPSELSVDEAFDPPVSDPAFAQGQGPVVVVDERHHNVVSLASYLRPVGRFLTRDGYSVRAGKDPFSKLSLDGARVVVIANAQGPTGAPPGTQAFPEQEIHALEKWVRAGGGLLLIADRAPFGGPVTSLARAFGVTLDDNTILKAGDDGKPTGVLTIDVAAQGDASHPIFAGVSRVVYVVGESVSGPGAVLKAPRGTYTGATAEATRGPSAAGKPLILAFAYGSGRVVVIGDAGIVSAFGSVGGEQHRGISEADNARFVRNVFRWLAR